ncbi:hypothetical protein NIES4074_10820 [Cylindrospermum sp. NIES-4074]|nr:hypothetical protein NIES4074_10820 [Cylindrospermum sp. NIES-4074]
MEIQYRRSASESNFEIIPTPDRKIIKQFLDYETGYLVVMEISTDYPTDTNSYYTLIDPNTGLIISPQARLSSIEGWERTIVDEEHGLQLTSRRTVDLPTGQETLHETLIEIANGKVKSTGESTPFAPEPSPNLLDKYLERQAEKQRNSNWWEEEYAQMSLEEKQGFWLHNTMLQMRFQGESGYDEYAFFTPENYDDWLAKEPEIDQILDFVIENIPDDTETVRAQINQRLGRS